MFWQFAGEYARAARKPYRFSRRKFGRSNGRRIYDVDVPGWMRAGTPALPVEPEQSYTSYRRGAQPVRLGDRQNWYVSNSTRCWALGWNVSTMSPVSGWMRAGTPALPVMAV